MINRYVSDIAAHMGIPVLQVNIVEGQAVGCYDVFLLHLATGARRVTALIYQVELDNLLSGATCDRLEVRIRIALSRLKSLTEPKYIEE